MKGRRSSPGIALVAALLTLAGLTTLATASLLLVQVDLRLARNRQLVAEARAESHSRMVVALLTLEAASVAGELPAEPPSGLPHPTEYRRLSPRSAFVSVSAGEGGGEHRREATVELREAGGGWRLHIVERR